MFNGIISSIGILLDITACKLSSDVCFKFKANHELCSMIRLGSSVSCSGVCLTVVKIEDDCFFVELSQATIFGSKFCCIKENDEINLELPMKFNGFVDGHLLQGHVDAVCKVLDIRQVYGSHIFTMEMPSVVLPLIVDRGSVGIDGVSLTVINQTDLTFDVNIIPYTYANTTFRNMKIGDYANIETDIIGRYVKKLIDLR